tara:strand:- start:3242 stop:3478 length:237 start_codon:yes stop_codon:yes gene_type:complete
MAAKKLRIGTSLLTNRVFAGTLLKDGRTWGASKQDVTVEATAAVVEHCLGHEKLNDGEKVALTDGKTKWTITIKEEAL